MPIDPITGAFVMGGASLLGQGLSSWMGSEATKEAAAKELAGIQAGIRERRAAGQDVADMYQPYTEAGKQGLGALTEGIYGGQFETPVEDFQYQGQISDFLDPSS